MTSEGRKLANVLLYRSPYETSGHHRRVANAARRRMRLSVHGGNRAYQFLTPEFRSHPLGRRLAVAALGTASDLAVDIKHRSDPSWDGFIPRWAASLGEALAYTRWSHQARWSAGLSLFLVPEEFESTILRSPASGLLMTTATGAAVVADSSRRDVPVNWWSWRYTIFGYVGAIAYRYRIKASEVWEDALIEEQVETRRLESAISTVDTLAESTDHASSLNDLVHNIGDLRWTSEYRRLDHLRQPAMDLRAVWSDYRSGEQARADTEYDKMVVLHLVVLNTSRRQHGGAVNPETDLDRVNVEPPVPVPVHPQQIGMLTEWLDRNLGPDHIYEINDELCVDVEINTAPDFLGDEFTFTVSPESSSARTLTVPRAADGPPRFFLDLKSAAYMWSLVHSLDHASDNPVATMVRTAGTGMGLALSVTPIKDRLDDRHHMWIPVLVHAASVLAWTLERPGPTVKHDGTRWVFPVSGLLGSSLILSALWPTKPAGPGTGISAGRHAKAALAAAAAASIAGVAVGIRNKRFGFRDVLGEAIFALQPVLPARALYRDVRGPDDQTEHNDLRSEFAVHTRAYHIFASVLRPSLEFVELLSEELATITTAEFKGREHYVAQVNEIDGNRAELLKRAVEVESRLIEILNEMTEASRVTPGGLTPHIVIDAPALGEARADGSRAPLFSTSADLSEELIRASIKNPLPLPYLINLRAAAGIAARHGRSFVVDIDRTLIHLDTPHEPGVATEALVKAVEVIAASRAGFGTATTEPRRQIGKVFFVSNGSRPLVAESAVQAGERMGMDVTVVLRARKAHPSRGPLAAHEADLAGAVVYGDHMVTDGRLARAVGGIWVQPPWATSTRDIGLKGRHANSLLEAWVGQAILRNQFVRLL